MIKKDRQREREREREIGKIDRKWKLAPGFERLAGFFLA